MDSSELRDELQKLKDSGQLRANPIIIATVHATRLNAEGNNIPFILWPSPLMLRGSRWRGFAIFIGTPASDRGVSPHFDAVCDQLPTRQRVQHPIVHRNRIELHPVPPNPSTTSFTRCPISCKCTCPGTNCVNEFAIATIGFSKSSVFIPIVRQSAPLAQSRR